MLSLSPYQGLTGQSCRHPDHDSKEQFNCAVSENRDRPKISILHSSQVSHFPCNPYSQSGGILTAQPLTLFLVINMYVCLWIYSNHFIQNKVSLLFFCFFFQMIFFLHHYDFFGHKYCIHNTFISILWSSSLSKCSSAEWFTNDFLSPYTNREQISTYN